jgi:hypothetical protein
MRRASAYSQILNVLHELQREYPQYNMGRHLATSLDEYGDVWGIPDNEILFALNKYRAQLHMDVEYSEIQDIERIMEDGIDLDNILKEEDNGDY